MVLSIGIKLQLSALNSLTIVPPNYPSLRRFETSQSFPSQAKSFCTGHVSVSMPRQCFQVTGMQGHGRMALEAQELTQPEQGRNN